MDLVDDGSFKMNPPLASVEDQKALIEGNAKYNDYILTIKFNFTQVTLFNRPYNIPFLYSNSIQISVNEKNETINLNFKIYDLFNSGMSSC